MSWCKNAKEQQLHIKATNRENAKHQMPAMHKCNIQKEVGIFFYGKVSEAHLYKRSDKIST